jgi:glutamyl-tRNA reductase
VNQLPLVLIGVDFRRAPTRYRAALALSESARDELVATLREHGATGLVVLETCNRTEWLVAFERPAWVV